MGRISSFLVMLVALACASMMPAATNRGETAATNDQVVRIALATGAQSGRIGASGAWKGYAPGGGMTFPAGTAGDSWFIRPSGSSVRVEGSGGEPSAHRSVVIRPTGDGSYATWNGKRYRGELIISATDSGLLVVNRVALESYLRGVVPLEIGNRKAEEHAAVEAQAVAARSYSYLHLVPTRAYDMMSTVQDQVYGGVDAEKPVSDAAVASTDGMVVMYAGKVINTPYFSTCGGSTAYTREVWYKEPDQPYLKPVSDRIPGTDRFYCDSSPRFRWTSSFTGESLRSVLEKYLSAYTSAPRGSLGRVTGVYEQGRTESDRVAALRVETDRGSYLLRGNDIRFVLRSANGEILNSTYFTAEATITSGEVSGLTLRGGGYGHGIGMCQWGAIGRARAGQDYQTILSTYYPGTTIGRAR
ncbi:MAG: SpoIID/LytB domain-containing protein [Gemmatimonadota bacterium]|nr:SpoIID/LytB domain-containing protein [Gemmatimonadota bacterium]